MLNQCCLTSTMKLGHTVTGIANIFLCKELALISPFGALQVPGAEPALSGVLRLLQQHKQHLHHLCLHLHQGHRGQPHDCCHAQ